MATILTAGNATNGMTLTPDNTGILQIKTGTGAGTTALTLDASQNATFAGTVATVTGTVYPLVSATAQTAPFTAPNTYADFTGIPSTAKRITVMFSGVSTNGSSLVIIQAGSGSFETSGYLGASVQTPNASAASTAAYTTGILIDVAQAATAVRHGILFLSLLNSSTNLWAIGGSFGRSDVAVAGSTGGSKAFAGTLDRIRVTTVNGTDTFDAGSVNILWE